MYTTDTVTAAKRAARIEFVQARNVALGLQRDIALRRLTALRHDIRQIHEAITSDGELSDPDGVLAALERMNQSERTLVADIDRLGAKIARP